MKQIKIFKGDIFAYSVLEKEINRFLFSEKIQLIDHVVQSIDETVLIISITYSANENEIDDLITS